MKTVSIEYITKKLIEDYINKSPSLLNSRFPTFTMIKFINVNGDLKIVLNENDNFYLIDDGNKGFYIILNGKIINHKKDILNQIKI